MEISIDQCVFGANVVQVGFDTEDPKCQSEIGHRDDDKLDVDWTEYVDEPYVVRSELDTCGMVMNPGNETIDFTNTLSVLARHSLG